MNALDVLLDCFIAELCDAPQSELFALMDTLERRYPGNVRFLLLRYRYLRATGVSPDHRLALLERARRMQPGNTLVYQYQLAEFSESGNLSGLYEAVRAWMLYDDGRQSLPAMHRLFAPQVTNSQEQDQ